MAIQTVQDISEIIRTKEKELQEFNELRYAQLERMVEERDQHLIEASKRFDLLRDDFQYNLRLLEARDQEIVRLDGVIKAVEIDRERISREHQSSLAQLTAMEERYQQLVEKADTDRKKSKEIFDSLKLAIESLKWTSSESAKSSRCEMETLKEEIRQLNFSKDEALEAQRRDLTSSYEGIIQQREASFSQREKEIVAQIASLENKIHTIIAENARLKSEVNALHNEADSLRTEMSSREDQIRHLKWALEDVSHLRHDNENSLNEKIQEQAIEMASLKDLIAREKIDNQRSLENMTRDLVFERENSRLISQKLDESKQSLFKELSRLEGEIRDHLRKEQMMTEELIREKLESQSLRDSIQSIRFESEVLTMKLGVVESENRRLQEELSSNRSESVVSEKYKLNFESEIQTLKEKYNSQALVTQKEWAEKINNLRSAEIERSQELEREYQKSIEELRSKLEVQYNERLLLLQDELAEMKNQETRHIQQIQDLQSSLESERANFKVLRLQFEAFRAQAHPNETVKNMKSTTSSFDMNLDSFHLDEIESISPEYLPSKMNSSFLSASASGAASPVDFIEKAFEAPNSSIAGNLAQLTQENFNLKSIVSQMRREMQELVQSVEASETKAAEPSTNLIDENQKLKDIIRDMRCEMEALMTQEQTDHKMKTNGGSDSSKIELLENRLEQSLHEISRLKKERLRLMELGNELRSALHVASQDSSKGSHFGSAEVDSNRPEDNRKALAPAQAPKPSFSGGKGEPPIPTSSAVPKATIESTTSSKKKQASNSLRETEGQLRVREKLSVQSQQYLNRAADQGGVPSMTRKIMNYARSQHPDDASVLED